MGKGEIETNLLKNSNNRFLFLLLLSIAVTGCTPVAPLSGIPMKWKQLSSGEISLPDGIWVFEGSNSDLPLRAWYVQVEESDPRITTRIVVSDDADRKESASEFAGRLGASVVVNGGYFRMNLNPARHVGLLYIDREMVQSTFLSVLRDTLRYYTTRAALGFTPGGKIDVAWVSSRNDSLFEWRSPPPNTEGIPSSPLDFMQAVPWMVRDALAAGPALLQAGRIQITADQEVFFGSSIPMVHPRTAAGYTDTGDLILLVVDGRQAVSRGVDLVELATIMRDIGCVEALNLDGGGSSTLVVNGTLINRPAGGDYQREVMSAVAVFHH